MINLEKEIREQPAVLAGVIPQNMEKVRALVAAIRAADITNVQFAARGTSDHASIYAQYLLHTIVGIPCGLATPSVVSQYHGKMNYKHTLVIGVSQSGKASDVLAVMARAKETGAITVAVTNDESSPMAKAADYHLFCHAGEEISIAATKTFTAQMMVLALLAAVWAEDEKLVAALSGVSADVSALLSKMPQELDAAIGDYTDMTAGVVFGRGFAYPIACEGTLKILETNGIKMRGYAASDFHHGPKAQVHAGDTVFAIVLRGAVESDALALMDEMLALGAKVVLVTDDASLCGTRGVRTLLIPNSTDYPIPDALGVYTAAITMQLFALKLVEARGIDPDASRVLKKVTITV